MHWDPPGSLGILPQPPGGGEHVGEPEALGVVEHGEQVAGPEVRVLPVLGSDGFGVTPVTPVIPLSRLCPLSASGASTPRVREPRRPEARGEEGSQEHQGHQCRNHEAGNRALTGLLGARPGQ